MALIIETGAGLSNSDTYASLAEATAYTTAYGLPWGGSDAAKEAALRRATAFIDATYRGRFVGYRKFGRAQALEWPRSGGFSRVFGASGLSSAGEALADNAVPAEVVKATIIAASSAVTNPGGLATTTTTTEATPAGEIKRRAAGDHVTEYYQSRAASTTTATATEKAQLTLGLEMENILLPVLVSRGGNTTFLLRA